jgi:hypothetical protein
MRPNERLSREIIVSHYYWCLKNGRDVSWYDKMKKKKS